MKTPRLLHDYVIGWSEDMRVLFEDVESGKRTHAEAQDCFTTDEGEVLGSVFLMWSLLLGFRQYGQETFVVGPRLREMLENTSLTGVPWAAVKWPFPFFYVSLPDCPHSVWGGPTGWHPLTGILVGFSDDGEQLAIYLWGDEKANARAVGDDASFWFNVPLRQVQEQGGDMEAYVDSLMRDESTEWTDGSGVEINPRSASLSKAQVTRKGAADEHTITLAKNTLRIVINLCIYLQSTAPERSAHPKYVAEATTRAMLESEMGRKKNPGKKKRVQRDLDKLSKARVTWLGRSIEEIDPRKPLSGSTATTSFWVRGHWWPRLDNREAKDRHGIRWVQPYQKNKDLEPDAPRQYRIVGDVVQVDAAKA
jgi:hypothetical protein